MKKLSTLVKFGKEICNNKGAHKNRFLFILVDLNVWMDINGQYVVLWA